MRGEEAEEGGISAKGKKVEAVRKERWLEGTGARGATGRDVFSDIEVSVRCAIKLGP